MTPTDILIAARAKIAQGWTRRAYARTADGFSAVEVDDPKAAQWCVIGALRAVTSADFECAPAKVAAAAYAARNFLDRTTSSGDIMAWNDVFAKDQADVLAAFDRAIEISKGHA